MVDHVDEMREVEFREEIHFYFEGLFLAGAREVDLEGVERVVFAAEVDTKCGESYLACPPSPRRRWTVYSSAYCSASIK